MGSFKWETYLKSNETIEAGTLLYRARIIPNNKEKLLPEDMGCPPKEKALAGRANPLGMPYLYLCNNMETTLYEIRAIYLDKINVGEFKIIKDLNIVDFSKKINLLSGATDQEWIDIVKRKFLFDKISEDLSKPLRRFDTEIEYVPTQLICEYCKLNGADGIRFNSSLHQEGTNVVLFNDSDAKCIRVLSCEITKVTIKSKLI